MTGSSGFFGPIFAATVRDTSPSRRRSWTYVAQR
jgi:hypothetical protein